MQAFMNGNRMWVTPLPSARREGDDWQSPRLNTVLLSSPDVLCDGHQDSSSSLAPGHALGRAMTPTLGASMRR